MASLGGAITTQLHCLKWPPSDGQGSHCARCNRHIGQNARWRVLLTRGRSHRIQLYWQAKIGPMIQQFLSAHEDKPLLRQLQSDVAELRAELTELKSKL